MQISAINSATERQYKVRARGMSRCPDIDTCRMEISVGQPYHEGPKLRAALKWAERFPRVHILLGDSPQRFNLMHEMGLDERDAESEARRRGDDWLSRNGSMLADHPRFELTRWNDWKHTGAYITTRWQVGRLYRDNDMFQAAIDDATAAAYARRQYTDWERFSALSLTYLLEESAVFALVYGGLRGFSAYPGSFLDTWSQFTNQNIAGAPEGFKFAHNVVLGFD